VGVDTHAEGGTYALGGTSSAELNITYNYAPQFKTVFGDAGIRDLHNKVARDTISALEIGVSRLGTQRSADYWENTPGNAGYVLSVLLAWAKQHPNAVFLVI
jgi:hypothetical protein